VLDTGVAYANRGRYRRSPDFKASTFVRGYDFVDHDPYADDPQGHGTHVAGTIAEATDNGYGLTGLAFGARIMPVRVLDENGEGDASTIARGVRWAARNGAQVINLSLEFSSDVTAANIPALIKAIRYANRKGAVIVGASGNEAYGTVAYPARASQVIAVGATTERGCLAEYSNQGRGLDLVAPGGGADADLPDDPNCAPELPPGREISQITYRDSRLRFGISREEGTSMAVPHVSAAAAMVIASQAYVDRNGLRPRARIVASASAGVPPEIMGIGPVPATRKVLERAGWSTADLGAVELNEAFASQSLACIRDLGLDPETVNADGGAIALGHPLGASGARILLTLLGRLERTGAHRGLATMCVGVGQGTALLVERP